MPDISSYPALLGDIYICGEHLREALEAGDLDAVAALTSERASLVHQLHTMPQPTPLPAVWTEAMETLRLQYLVLTDLLTKRERELSEALAAIAQHRQACTSYDEPAAPGSILNSVHG